MGATPRRYVSLVHSFPAQVAIVALAVGLTACSAAPYFIQNIHSVVPGVVYRSAQLSPERLSGLIAERGVKTVLNLRGAFPGEAWYDGEHATVTKAGVKHIDFELSSKLEVPPAQAEELIRIMREAPKPLLIHCWGGADRTGLASALYLYAIHEKSSSEASAALSVKYHHLSFTSAGAMDRSFEKYVQQQQTRASCRMSRAVDSADPLLRADAHCD